MMGQLQKQIFFNAPIEKVWSVWTDVEKTTDWVDGIQESKITSSIRKGKGVQWNEKCLFGGKKIIQMSHTYVEFEPLKKTRTETGLPMGSSMETRAEFKSAGPTSTEAQVWIEWDMGIVGAMMGEDKLQHMMEKSFNKTVENWKKRAEA